MPNNTITDCSISPVLHRFITPMESVYPESTAQYICTAFPDLDFLRMGVLRVLSNSKSGRDFIQKHADHGHFKVGVDLFFKALGSARRLKNLSSVNDLLSAQVKERMVDPFRHIAELDNFDIYSGDGHYKAAACHDQSVERRDGSMSRLPVGNFFQLNMRSHFLRHLTQAETGGARKSEHDLRAVKRLGAMDLRSGAKKGRQVIYLWDRAIIDFEFWYLAKANYGLYFLTLDKKGMKLDDATPRDFDSTDSRNVGIIDDEYGVSRTKKYKIRRIHYVDPATGESYTYLTTEMTLPPGVLVLLYRHRWDIEKVFDELKTKLEEKKAWGSSREAKSMQANFECLTHNLMLLVENDLEIIEGVVNEQEVKRRLERKIDIEEKSKGNGGASFVATAVQRITQRSLKFIRWLRNHVYQLVPWCQAVRRLREAYLM